MDYVLNKEWWYAAGIRAIKTMAQTALGMFTVGAAFSEVQWSRVISVAIVSAVYSLLTSLATNLPEVSTDGVITITDTDTEGTYEVGLHLNEEEGFAAISDKKRVVFSVNDQSSRFRA